MKPPPDISITRLAIYLRFLEDYIRENGACRHISSEELARLLNINHHQIRKDLSYFGKFGERGIGYNVIELKDRISRILGLSRKWNLCLCGLGNLGSALIAYEGFRKMNLNIVAIFDNDKKKLNMKVSGAKVYSPGRIREIVNQLSIDMAIIAVPQNASQTVTDELVRAGVKAILNFAPIKLVAPKDVKLRNVDFSTEMINLTYFLSQSQKTDNPD
jgi:redox-sensing transcriptional repressor